MKEAGSRFASLRLLLEAILVGPASTHLLRPQIHPQAPFFPQMWGGHSFWGFTVAIFGEVPCPLASCMTLDQRSNISLEPQVSPMGQEESPHGPGYGLSEHSWLLTPAGSHGGFCFKDVSKSV